mgnify:CR=1 FL=1
MNLFMIWIEKIYNIDALYRGSSVLLSLFFILPKPKQIDLSWDYQSITNQWNFKYDFITIFKADNDFFIKII